MIKKSIFLFALLAISVSNLYAEPVPADIDLQEVFAEDSPIWLKYTDNEKFISDHDDDRYAVIGTRLDGTFAVIIKRPGFNEGDPDIKTGYFMKCGKRIDSPIFFSDVESLSKNLKNPSIDNPNNVIQFDETMSINDTYITICGG